MNDRLKCLRRQQIREYGRKGKSEKYDMLKKSFEEAFKREALKYKNKIQDEVWDGKRGSAYNAIRKLGAKNPEIDTNFYIPAHTEENLSAQESAKRLANHFSSISQEFEPLDQSKFSPSLRDKLADHSEQIPHLEDASS